MEILFNLDHPDVPPIEVIEVEDDSPGAEEEGTDRDEEEDEEEPNLQERCHHFSSTLKE